MGNLSRDILGSAAGGVNRRRHGVAVHRSPHSQTDREIEVLVNVYDDGREAVVFHAMELGPKFRRYREENSNG